ncbi:hypothetical protein Bca101_027338 [Brassica carinata]
MVCIVAAKAAVFFTLSSVSCSIASLTEGGGVYLCLRWWFVAVPAAWCQRWSSMAAMRRCCDLPPFRLFSSRLVFQEPTFEASSTGFLGLCLCALWRRLVMMLEVLCGLRILSVSSVAPSGASHIPVLWLPLGCSGSVVALILLCRSSSSSGSRAAVNLFPSSCLPLLAGRVHRKLATPETSRNSRHPKGEPHILVVNTLKGRTALDS